MTDFTWKAPTSIASALTTELNSLANGSYSSVSTAYDNETNKHLYLDLELVLASLTPTGTPSCPVFLVAQVDGTNYEDSPNAASIPIAIFAFTTATAAKRQIRSNILVPPLSFKLGILNSMGVSLASSGNTLKYRLHDELGT
jgi:hypothetical protein